MIAIISRNPRKPEETYSHTRTHLSLAEKKFRLGRFETLMRFEKNFYMEKHYEKTHLDTLFSNRNIVTGVCEQFLL